MIAARYPTATLRRVLLDEPQTEWRMSLGWRRGAYLAHAARAWLSLTPAFETPAI
jgi:hypothetical protein